MCQDINWDTRQCYWVLNLLLLLFPIVVVDLEGELPWDLCNNSGQLYKWKEVLFITDLISR